MGHSVVFHYALQLANPSAPIAAANAGTPSQTLEGLWWKQEPNVAAFVAITNPGSKAISANLFSSDAQGNSISQHSVTISAHGTKMLDLPELPQAAGISGGLRVTYDGAANDLLVSGGLRDVTTGFSANIPFAPSPAPAGTASTVTYAELGLMTGAADPMMSFPVGTTFTPYTIVRNISNQPITFTSTLWWMAGGIAKSANLPQVSLAALRTLNLNMLSLLAQAGLKNYNGSVNLVLNVTANTSPGAMLLSSGSVDQKNTYVFQVIPEGVKESIAKNLSYWSTMNGDDTMVTLWNPAEEAQDFLFTLFYADGHYKYPLHLEPRATSMFNISEILHSAIPDAEGNIIPARVHEGSAELAGSQGESEHILVAMDAGTYNIQKATCGPYCKTCQGAVNSWITDNPFATPLGTNHQLAFTVQNHSGNQVNETSNGVWSSSNANIATVNVGLVRPLSAGGFRASAGDDSYPFYATLCSSIPIGATCPFTTGVYSDSPGTVQKPGFLQIVSSTTSPACTTGLGCAREILYRVIDTNSGAMNIPNMSVVESVMKSSGNCPASLTDNGRWVTDSTGTLNSTDQQLACLGANDTTTTCTLVYTQKFTVNGYPVFILSQDGTTAGSKNTITFQINKGISACPISAITP